MPEHQIQFFAPYRYAHRSFNHGSPTDGADRDNCQWERRARGGDTEFVDDDLAESSLAPLSRSQQFNKRRWQTPYGARAAVHRQRPRLRVVFRPNPSSH